MGVQDRLLLQSSFFALLIVFSSTPLTCNGQFTTNWFETIQIDALQALLGAWNESTPDLEKNLAGWNSSSTFPCSQEYTVGQNPNWRGVECIQQVGCQPYDENGYRNCSAYITGLSLDNAHIAGFLPPEMGNISTLTALELTGNPNLTGTLPWTLAGITGDNMNLQNLDLHDNGFSGEIPDFQYLQNVDLSGNRFNSSSGFFPLPTMRRKRYAEKLSLGRNDFEGPIPEEAFRNMSQLVQLNLSSNRFTGPVPTLSNCTSLQILDLSNNSFSGTLPNLTTMPSLRTLNLSSNAFTGSARDFWKSSELQELYLDRNLLNGSIDISQLYSLGLLNTRSSNSDGLLRVLSLMNNSISHVNYDVTMIEDIITIISLQGNPYCDVPNFDDGTRCFCNQTCKYTVPVIPRKDDKRNIVIIAVVASVSSLLILLAGLAATFHGNKKYKQYCEVRCQQEFQQKCGELEVKPTIFPYNELRTATRDFHLDMKLGQGSFGAVYKGILPNRNVVAVKQLLSKTTQGIDEFLNEVVLLTGMKHRNLVNLKGCCIREQQRLLVYEYVENYDIDKVLLSGFNQATKVFLNWPIRLKICLGVAHGLHYLHELAQPRIIHRDIKPSNILLGKNYETKIADFGLAHLFPDEESFIMTKHLAGTKGYLAPEYVSYGQLSDKVDIFSFGILCLEVVSRRRVIDEKLVPNKKYLPKWAWELHKQDSLMDLVDPTMSLQDEEKMEVHRLINISLLCIQNEAEKRPSIKQVVFMLQEKSESKIAVPKPHLEEQYLETIRLFGADNSDLSTLVEESESSFVNSSRQGLESFEESDSTCVKLELGEIRMR